MAERGVLEAKRILVVGASSGIGRALARHAVAMGGRVCVAARRHEKLLEVCAEAGGGHAVAGDVTDADDARRIVNEAADHLDGLDLVVYAAGVTAVRPIIDIDPEVWRQDYAVNVIGATLVAAAALPVLAQDGLISFLSSESTAEARWGMSSYAASKSALDATIRSWRLEHPDRRFQRIVMGATMPTGFADHFDMEILTVALDRWVAGGISMTAMDTDDVGRQLAEVLAVVLAHPAIDVPDLCLDPRGAPWT